MSVLTGSLWAGKHAARKRQRDNQRCCCLHRHSFQPRLQAVAVCAGALLSANDRIQSRVVTYQQDEVGVSRYPRCANALDAIGSS